MSDGAQLTALDCPTRPTTIVAMLLVDRDYGRLIGTSAHKMSWFMTVEGAMAATTRPPGAEEALAKQPPAPQFSGKADPEIMSVLAKMQNACFAEMGYFPILLQEFHELKNQNVLLRGNNLKLYEDNCRLVQLINTQDQNERGAVEAMKCQLRTALNEIVLLRQERSRFIPSTATVPAHERMMISHLQQTAWQQKVLPMPAQHMIAQQTTPGHSTTPGTSSITRSSRHAQRCWTELLIRLIPQRLQWPQYHLPSADDP
ncbi:hypothetical protein VTO73DRAFT_13136 [Trametes versicolor]